MLSPLRKNTLHYYLLIQPPVTSPLTPKAVKEKSLTTTWCDILPRRAIMSNKKARHLMGA